MSWLHAIFLTILLAFAPPAGAQELYAAPAPAEVATWQVPELPTGWETVHGPFLRVHGESDEYGVMLALSRHAAESLPRLATELGVPIGDTIHVIVAPTRQAFWDLQPGNAPSWADGVTYPALGVIYLHAPTARDNTGTPLEKVLDHELVHVLLGRAFYPHPTPVWLQEGVARVYANEVSPDNTEVLARGMATTGLLSLTALDSSFPRDALKAQLAYAQSADFITFLRVEHGPEALPKLIRALARGDGIDSAMHQATGQWLDDVDESWRSRLESGIPLSFTALTVDGVLLGFGGIALVVGGLFRRRRFHRRLAEMEAEEALVDELIAKLKAEEAERSVVREWQALVR